MTKSNIPHFQQATNSLAKKFTTFFDQYALVKDWLNLSEGQTRLIERRRSWIERLEHPEFPVAFLGNFSAGKSTIINALIGKDLLPESTKALTGTPTVIRSGAVDAALVHFLDQSERIELFNLWVEELGDKLKKDLPLLTADDNPKEFLVNLTARVDEIGDTEVYVKKSLDNLRKLVRKWQERTQSLPIQITELPKYVTSEKFQDHFLIRRVEVTLAGLVMPTGMVLVDLPGLGVDNPLHKKITKDYIEKEAKAFIVCFKPDSMMEGDEIRFLDEVNRQNPRILNRAFWLINKWDLQNDMHKAQIRATFQEKIADHGFKITEERRYEVSALNFLLVNALVSGEINKSTQLKEHLGSLNNINVKQEDVKAASLPSIIAQQPVLNNFHRFQQTLHNYLEGSALEEFLVDAQHELSSLLNIVLPRLESLSTQYEVQGNSDEDLQFNFVNKELGNIRKSLLELIEQTLKEIRIHNYASQPCWDANAQREMKTIIEGRIKNLDRRELISSLSKGIDRDQLYSNLPAEVSARLKVAELLREKMREQIGDNYIATQMEVFLTELDSQIHMPVEFANDLNQLLGSKIIYSRVEGLADALLFQYGEKLDEIGSMIMEEIKRNAMLTLAEKEAEISQALAIYETVLLEYLDALSVDVNRYAQRLTKNFAEATLPEMEFIFDKHQSAFTTLIRKDLSFDESLQAERNKRMTLNEALMNFNKFKGSSIERKEEEPIPLEK